MSGRQCEDWWEDRSIGEKAALVVLFVILGAGLGHPGAELHPVRQDRRKRGQERQRKRELRAYLKQHQAEEGPQAAADPQ